MYPRRSLGTILRHTLQCAITCPLMALKGMVAAVVLGVLSVLTLVL